MTTLETLKEIIADQFVVSEADVHENSDLRKDFDADSLDEVELVMEIKDQFDIEIPDGEAEKCRTVGDLVNLIEKLR